MKTPVIQSSKILALVVFFLIGLNLQAQQKLNLKAGSQEFSVKGTSTLHDWHMTSEEGEGFVQVSESAEGVLNFTGSEITLVAETLKSGKRGMDKNAYKALNTDEFPNIQFVLVSCNMESATAGKATGKLTIAGTTRNVIFDITVEKSGDAFTVKGSTDFRLTDYQIDPPTALMGTIKTGDDVTIEFNATFQN